METEIRIDMEIPSGKMEAALIRFSIKVRHGLTAEVCVVSLEARLSHVFSQCACVGVWLLVVAADLKCWQ